MFSFSIEARQKTGWVGGGGHKNDSLSASFGAHLVDEKTENFQLAC